MTLEGVPNNISSGKLRKLYILINIYFKKDQHISKNKDGLPSIGFMPPCMPQFQWLKTRMTCTDFAQTYKLLCEVISLKIMKIKV